MNPVFLSHSKPDGARLTSMRPPARVAGGELESHWPARPAQAGRRPRPRSRLASRLSARRQGHRAEGHAASAEGRHEIAAGLAVVVAVDGAAVGVGEVGRNDLESIALREVRLGRGQQRNRRGLGVRSGHGRSQADGPVARDDLFLDLPRGDARELISRKFPGTRDEPAELNLERCLGLRSCLLAVADLDLDGFPAHRRDDNRWGRRGRWRWR